MLCCSVLFRVVYCRLCCFGHVSFPGALSEWQIVVFPQSERTLGKLKEVVSPCVIEVISSVDFQVGIFLCHVITVLVNTAFVFSKNNFHIFILKTSQIHPDEVEDDSEVMLIWDFNVDKINLSLTASQSLVKPQTSTSAERLPIMPLLDLNKVVCNCENVLRDKKILLENCAAASTASDLRKLSIVEVHVPVDTEEDGVDNETSEEDEEDNKEFGDLPQPNDRDHEAVEFTSRDKTNGDSTETLFTESFKLKGSSFHEHFQRSLKTCKEKLMNKISVPLKLHFEPINRRDENAILVLAYPENSWEPIGYIPGIKLAKVLLAVRNEEIRSVTITSVRYRYIFPIASFKYFATVTISKKDKWLKNKDSYKSLESAQASAYRDITDLKESLNFAEDKCKKTTESFNECCFNALML